MSHHCYFKMPRQSKLYAELAEDVKILRHLLNTEKLYMAKKLVLMIDLDHTLLHTNVKDIAAAETTDELIRWRVNENWDWTLTKFRPHVREFLRNMSRLYELRICTMAGGVYVKRMVNFLDEDGLLFGNRIHSIQDLDEDQKLTKSKTGHLSNLFPRGVDNVVIIDDREDVWNSPSNLIKVNRYSFFSRGSDNKMTVPASDNDNYLPYLETLLRRVHHNFFAAYAAYKKDSSAAFPTTKVIVPKCGTRISARMEKRHCALQSRRRPVLGEIVLNCI